ncbi:hypothetical protein CCR97_21325 [Rhodoplanes elegans]|uniref:Peptidase C1A papain C-terminal domain-containing protein n=1 Tax=Rhodoplanes elegans TaxID=29408 RepID=A0A327KPH6_9BRAD|nr:C1 family peptidase [Rhodoplanes elegans]MBK5960724.1 hypothetical protein [Rhodoplanes elegans]RAI40800.1 hypothetical protein CH338_05130 [Rhodoplanes elegans]
MPRATHRLQPPARRTVVRLPQASPWPVSAALLAVFAAGLLGPGVAVAQSAPPPDPLDTVYANGDAPIDEATKRSLATTEMFRAFLPLSVDLSGSMPLPGRQGKLPSCTAWAVAYAARSYYVATAEGRDVRQAANVPSPAYVYHLARTQQDCTGTSFVRNIDVLRRGAPSLASYPYADQCTAPPGPGVTGRPGEFQVRGYRRIDLARIDDVKGQLALSNPVLISFADSVAFQKHRGDGVFAEPDFTGPRGWHAMTLTGYDDRRQAFRLINSWGTGWGDRGYAWIGYDTFRQRVREAGILDVERSVRPPPPPPVAPVPSPPVTPLPPPGPKPGPTVQPLPPPVPPAGQVVAADLPELRRLACAKVTARRDAGRTLLSGFVASTDDLDTVRRAAASRPGFAVGEIVVAPWPQCEALQTLDDALDVADRPTVDIGGRAVLRDGDPLRIAVRTPSRPRYLYVSYVQVDGSLVHLVQPRDGNPAPAEASRTLVFGDGSDGRARATVSAPFGREMIIAIASTTPLFPRALPTRQTEREYLSALRRALLAQPSASAAGATPGRDVAATVLSLETRGR